MAKSPAHQLGATRQSFAKNKKSFSQGSGNLMLILGAVIVVIVAAGVGFGIYFTRQKPLDIQDNRTANFVLLNPVGGNLRVKVVDIFEDPMCPICKDYEETPGAKELVEEALSGKVILRYRMLTVLNQNSVSGDYSSRANAALLAIAHSSLPKDQRTKFWSQVHTLFFSSGFQPPELGQGTNPANYTNDQLASHIEEEAKKSSITLPDDLISDIKAGKYVAEANDLAATNYKIFRQIGLTGTPTLYCENKQYGLINGPIDGVPADKNPDNIASVAFAEFITGVHHVEDAAPTTSSTPSTPLPPAHHKPAHHPKPVTKTHHP